MNLSLPFTTAAGAASKARRFSVNSWRCLPLLALGLGLSSQVQAQSVPLQMWSMRVSNQDSALIRSSAVTASTPTLRKLGVSDGTTEPDVPAYSARWGQALGPAIPPATSVGNWRTSNVPPGPGGTLNRTYYEQFTVTAGTGKTVRVDSLILKNSFFNSSSGTKLAVVYSKTGFTTNDSTNVSGGIGPGGVLPATANGGFTTPVSVPQVNITTPLTTTYRFALNGATGVTLMPGQTLTMRLYWACTSTSNGRYSVLRDVIAKGADLTVGACNAAFAYANASYCQSGTNPTPTVTGSTGGVFSSTTGLSLNATTGAVNLASSTPGTYTVTYTVSPTCSVTRTITIGTPGTAGFSYPSGNICVGSTALVTPSLATGATAGTFTASGTGLTINATTGAINPATSTAGTYTVTNTLPANGCATVSSTATVTVTATPSSAFSYPSGTFCQTGTNPTATITGATGGTFSVTPATGLTVNASTGAITLAGSTQGTYTVSYTVAGPCPSTTTRTVTITSTQAATFSYAATTYCTSSSTVSPTFATGASGGTFSSTTGLTINATTGVITPASSTPGTYTVTNTIAASGGCAAATATQMVTITAAPVATFTYPSTTICAGQTATVSPTPATGAALGTFTVSPATGLTVSAAGVIDPSTATAGTYTVTNTIAAANGCAAVTATRTVTIAPAANAAFSYANASYCAGTTTAATPTITGTAGGTFSVAPPTGLTVNASTGALTLSTAVPGTYTVAYALSGNCPTAVTRTVVISPVPAAPTISITGTPATGITLTSSASSGNQFFLNGMAVTGATGTSYLVNSGTKNGTYTVTTTNAAGCTSTASAPVAVAVTGTSAAQAAAALRLYPNPTSTGQLTAELANYRSPVALTLYNTLGQAVGHYQATSTLTLDLSALPAGVYLLRAQSAEGSSVHRIVRN